MTQNEAEALAKVKTYAFIGSAGTGKCQRAQLVASLLNADYIIDDGLVIHKGSIICGKSAKSERNQVSAIRRALFEFDVKYICNFAEHFPTQLLQFHHCKMLKVLTTQESFLDFLNC